MTEIHKEGVICTQTGKIRLAAVGGDFFYDSHFLAENLLATSQRNHQSQHRLTTQAGILSMTSSSAGETWASCAIGSGTPNVLCDDVAFQVNESDDEIVIAMAIHEIESSKRSKVPKPSHVPIFAGGPCVPWFGGWELSVRLHITSRVVV